MTIKQKLDFKRYFITNYYRFTSLLASKVYIFFCIFIGVLWILFNDILSIEVWFGCLFLVLIFIPLFKFLYAKYNKLDFQVIWFEKDEYFIEIGNTKISNKLDEINKIIIRKNYITIKNKKSWNWYIVDNINELADFFRKSEYNIYIK